MDPDPPDIKQFLQTYYERHDSYPCAIWSINHTDFGVIVAAIHAAGNDLGAISDYLHNELKDYQGFSRKIFSDEKGDRIDDFYHFYEIDADGRLDIQSVFVTALFSVIDAEDVVRFVFGRVFYFKTDYSAKKYLFENIGNSARMVCPYSNHEKFGMKSGGIEHEFLKDLWSS